MVEYKNQDEAHEDLHAHDTIVHEDDNEEVVDVIEDVSIRKKMRKKISCVFVLEINL